MFLQTKYVKDEKDWPDVQMFFLPHLMTVKGSRYKEKANFDEKIWKSYFGPIMGKHGYCASFSLLRPKSRFDDYLHITNAIISLFFSFFGPHTELSDQISLRTEKCFSYLHTSNIILKL